MAPQPKIAVGGAILLLVVVVAIIFLVWESGEDAEGDTPLSDEAVTDLEPPLDATELGWQDQDLSAHVELSLDGDSLRWQSREGNSLIEGPFIDGMELEWSHYRVDRWHLLRASHHEDAQVMDLRLWSHRGSSTAIVEVHTDHRWPQEEPPPTLNLRLWPDEAEGLDRAARLIGPSPDAIDAPIWALRASFEDAPSLGLSWPGGTSADAQFDDGLLLSWDLYPAGGDAFDCPIDEASSRQRSFAIAFELGDSPLLSASPPGLSPQANAAPLFIDPLAITDDPWVDGRARHASDLALRLRALAYGHSDRDDPRYGNGGLLGAGFYATFAIPARWWDDPDIQALRRSLERRPIDLIPLIEDDNSSIESSLALFRDPCQALSSVLNADDPTAHALLLDGDESASRPLTAPLAPVTALGTASTERALLLDQLFGEGPDDLFASSHDTHSMAIPLVATRNPLEEIWSDNLLQPERQGHWTIHEDLTRQLTRWELAQPPDAHATTSINAFARWNSISGDHHHPWWHSDGSLVIDHLDAQTPLLGLGDLPHPERSAIFFPSQIRDLTRSSPQSGFAIR